MGNHHFFVSTETDNGAAARMLGDVVTAYRMPTAGAHQPTFFSLRGPANALDQRAREAREFKDGWDGIGWMDGGIKSVLECSSYFVGI